MVHIPNIPLNEHAVKEKPFPSELRSRLSAFDKRSQKEGDCFSCGRTFRLCWASFCADCYQLPEGVKRDGPGFKKALFKMEKKAIDLLQCPSCFNSVHDTHYTTPFQQFKSTIWKKTFSYENNELILSRLDSTVQHFERMRERLEQDRFTKNDEKFFERVADLVQTDIETMSKSPHLLCPVEDIRISCLHVLLVAYERKTAPNKWFRQYIDKIEGSLDVLMKMVPTISSFDWSGYTHGDKETNNVPI